MNNDVDATMAAFIGESGKKNKRSEKNRLKRPRPKPKTPIKSKFIFPNDLKSTLSLSPLLTLKGCITEPVINQSPFLKVTGSSLNSSIINAQ